MPRSRRWFLREARMAKRRKHRASEGQDARSERPATGVGSPEPRERLLIKRKPHEPRRKSRAGQYAASPFAGPPSRIAAASPTPIRVQPMSR